MFNCTTDEYDLLYERWLRRPEELLLLGGFTPGMRLLDLCGGTGVVSLTAIKQFGGRDVTLLDLNPRPCCQLSTAWCNGTFKQKKGKAEKVDRIFKGAHPFDLVVCRQAIGYLDIDKAIPAVAKVLKPGGKFVFSSFTKPAVYGFKTYTHGASRFYEAHVHVLGRVAHLQWRLWYGQDFTLFKYHNKEKLMKLLHPWFDVVIHEEEHSLRWVCTRREG